MSSRKDLAPFFSRSDLSTFIMIPTLGMATKSSVRAENQNNERKRGFNTESYVFNTCHLWIWIMCRVFLTLSHPPTDSLYRKRLSIDGRQLNLEVFDPCSQVKRVTNTSKKVFLFCFFLFYELYEFNGFSSQCLSGLLLERMQWEPEPVKSTTQALFSKNTQYFKFLI